MLIFIYVTEQSPNTTANSILDFVNSTVIITCPFQPDRWLLNGYPFPEIADEIKLRLFIIKAQLRDSGKYECRRESILLTIIRRHITYVTVAGILLYLVVH